MGVSIYDGLHWEEYAASSPLLGPGTQRSYTVLGSKATQSFDAMGALATIAFACKHSPGTTTIAVGVLDICGQASSCLHSGISVKGIC